MILIKYDKKKCFKMLHKNNYTTNTIYEELGFGGGAAALADLDHNFQKILYF